MNETPDVLYGELYFDVQLKGIYSDSKTFVDLIPKMSPKDILNIYQQTKSSPNFDLLQFVNEYFDEEKKCGEAFKTNKELSIVEHIDSLWKILSRENVERKEGSSLLFIPYPYVVPGGRFNELFYWDTYFTMLGLEYSSNGKLMIEYLINNFVYLIDQYGFIPNGTRTYFLSRSQPPFFALMIDLLSKLNENPSEIRLKYLSSLEKEYQYWMSGMDQLNEQKIFHQVN